jgi:hypothetical protein
MKLDTDVFSRSARPHFVCSRVGTTTMVAPQTSPPPADAGSFEHRPNRAEDRVPGVDHLTPTHWRQAPDIEGPLGPMLIGCLKFAHPLPRQTLTTDLLVAVVYAAIMASGAWNYLCRRSHPRK